MNRAPADRLELAARGLAWGSLAVLVSWGVAFVFVALVARDVESNESDTARILRSTSLSLVPSGHRLRFVDRPATPGVDLRATPTLPPFDPDPARWLIHVERTPGEPGYSR